MSELKPCFTALGFSELPPDQITVIKRCGVLLEQVKGDTESDRLKRFLLIENRKLCLRELESEE